MSEGESFIVLHLDGKKLWVPPSFAAFAKGGNLFSSSSRITELLLAPRNFIHAASTYQTPSRKLAPQKCSVIRRFGATVEGTAPLPLRVSRKWLSQMWSGGAYGSNQARFHLSW